MSDKKQTKDVVECLGSKYAMIGHPKVFLHYNINGEAICPYCEKTFKR